MCVGFLAWDCMNDNMIAVYQLGNTHTLPNIEASEQVSFPDEHITFLDWLTPVILNKQLLSWKHILGPQILSAFQLMKHWFLRFTVSELKLVKQ